MKLNRTKKFFTILFFSFFASKCFAQPAIFFTQRDSGCINSVFSFQAIVVSPGDPVTLYTWNFGDGSPLVNTPTASEVHQFGTTGIFDVTLSITTMSGDTASLIEPGFIKICVPPIAVIDSAIYNICFHGSVQFNDLSVPPVTGWKWLISDGSISLLQNPVIQFIFDTSGVADPFDVVLIAYDNGCADTDTIVDMVTVLGPIPDYSFTIDCSISNTADFINVSGGADTYSWDFGDSSAILNTVDTSHSFPAPGLYNVKLTATNISNITADSVSYTST